METQHWALFLDDERNPSYILESLHRKMFTVRSGETVIKMVEAMGLPYYVSFDHDLGNTSKMTGYHVAKYFCDMDMRNKYLFPDEFFFEVHSQNPVGKRNIEEYMWNYFMHKGKE